MLPVPRKCITFAAAAALILLTSCGGEADRADEDDSSAETPPALSEIENDMWGSMLKAGSVTDEVDMAVFSMGDPIQAMRFGEVYGESDAPFENSGMLDGSASVLRRDGHELARVFEEDVVYLTGGAVLSMIDGPDSFAELDRSSMPSDLLEVWVDFSDEAEDRFTEGAFNVGKNFYEMHRTWYHTERISEHSVTPETISDQGTVEVRNDVEVWVYPGEYPEQELVVEANPEAPRMVALSYPHVEVHFKDWGEIEVPQRPDEDQVISLEEFEDRVLGATSEQ